MCSDNLLCYDRMMVLTLDISNCMKMLIPLEFIHPLEKLKMLIDIFLFSWRLKIFLAFSFRLFRNVYLSLVNAVNRSNIFSYNERNFHLPLIR